MVTFEANTQLIAASVTAIAATLVSATLGLARFAGAWSNVANHQDTPTSWAYATGPTIAELVFALIALGGGVAAVLSRPGRRPAFVALLAITVLATGFALNDMLYQIITSTYLRSPSARFCLPGKRESGSAPKQPPFPLFRACGLLRALELGRRRGPR